MLASKAKTNGHIRSTAAPASASAARPEIAPAQTPAMATTMPISMYMAKSIALRDFE
jgi:hypothetical protein